MFDLDPHVMAVRSLGVCEITGIPFDHTPGPRPFSASLDRTDPRQGYTMANTKVVVLSYNFAKNDGLHADVVRMAHALAARYPDAQQATQDARPAHTQG